MYKCPVCDKEYEKIKSLHGHMLKAHAEEYRAKGCKLSAYGITHMAIEKSMGLPPAKQNTPQDLRPLNKNSQLEAMAYNEGYRYLAGDVAYTAEEVKEMGWI